MSRRGYIDEVIGAVSSSGDEDLRGRGGAVRHPHVNDLHLVNASEGGERLLRVMSASHCGWPVTT